MRPTSAIVDLGALAANAAELARRAAPAELCAVVKADGYGHGAVAAARAALAGGAGRLAVALVEEGIELRQAGVMAPILLLSEPRPEEMVQVTDYDMRPTVYSAAGLAAAAAAATASGRRLAVHLKVDTGMHRVGAHPRDVPQLARAIAAKSGLELEGVWTHCAVADEPANDYTDRQLERFEQALATLAADARHRAPPALPGLGADPDSGRGGVLLGRSGDPDSDSGNDRDRSVSGGDPGSDSGGVPTGPGGHPNSGAGDDADPGFARRPAADSAADSDGDGAEPGFRRHAANSALLLAGAMADAPPLRQRSRYDMVRAGIALYGLPPSAELAAEMTGLRPAMGLRSRVAFVKSVAAGEGISYGLAHRFAGERRVATVPIGYADGVRRDYGMRGGEVLIRGRRRPVVGVVTMDQLMVDCGTGDDVAVGDEVVLIGTQAGETIGATEVAERLGTIPYEVVCDIGRRVRRHYR